MEAPKGGCILCGVGQPLPYPSEPYTPLPSALPLLPTTSFLPATCSVPYTAKTALRSSSQAMGSDRALRPGTMPLAPSLDHLLTSP